MRLGGYKRAFPAIRGAMLGRRQVVRHRFLVPAFAGSNPAAPANLIGCAIESAGSLSFAAVRPRGFESCRPSQSANDPAPRPHEMAQGISEDRSSQSGPKPQYACDRVAGFRDPAAFDDPSKSSINSRLHDSKVSAPLHCFRFVACCRRCERSAPSEYHFHRRQLASVLPARI